MILVVARRFGEAELRSNTEPEDSGVGGPTETGRT